MKGNLSQFETKVNGVITEVYKNNKEDFANVIENINYIENLKNKSKDKNLENEVSNDFDR